MAVVTVAGVVLIGAILRSGPEQGVIVPPADGVSGQPRADAAERAPAQKTGAAADAGPGGAGRAGPADPSAVARGFGLAFTRTSVGQEAWFAAVSSWLTPEQAAQYRNVPIEEIPTGELVEVDVAGPGAAPHTRGTLTYDTGLVLEVGLSHVETAGGWLVALVSLAESDRKGHGGRSEDVRVS